MLLKNHSRRAQKIDARDVQLLGIIQSHGRISQTELAARLGMSPSRCAARLGRLERTGVISGYRGMLDARRLASCICLYVKVALVRHRASDFTLFETAVRKIPEIIECDAVGGGIDYVLKVIARDIVHLQQTIDELLVRGCVQTYSIYIITKRIKEYGGVPLELLLDAARVPAGCERKIA